VIGTMGSALVMARRCRQSCSGSGVYWQFYAPKRVRSDDLADCDSLTESATVVILIIKTVAPVDKFCQPYRSCFVLVGGKMQIRCRRLMEGPGPSETIVSIHTTTGEEEVVVYTPLLSNGYLDVGPQLSRQSDRVLVELPREAASGRWRVWVPTSEVV
jgi:hypothetical protein